MLQRCSVNYEKFDGSPKRAANIHRENMHLFCCLYFSLIILLCLHIFEAATSMGKFQQIFVLTVMVFFVSKLFT